jgi:hypothetical protein
MVSYNHVSCSSLYLVFAVNYAYGIHFRVVWYIMFNVQCPLCDMLQAG